MLTEREVEIIDCFVSVWEQDSQLYGHISYAEVFEFLERIGAQKPEKLIAELNRLQQKSHEYQKENKD